jgi:very-short-patch-repair endonuclease
VPKTSGFAGFCTAIPTFSVHMRENVGIDVSERRLPDVFGADEVIARLASRQYGVVTRRQLLAAGITGAAIDRRVKNGRLWRVHQGIYAVGHTALSVHARVQAALLITPKGGASREAAAAILGLIPSMPAVIDVSVTGRAPRNRTGVRFHEVTHAEWSVVEGLRVTSPLRTLRDLGFPDRPTDEALAKRLVRPSDIDRPPTRSHLERTFLSLVKSAGLPQPLVNHRLGPYLVDFYWPEHHLVVETDGATHRHKRAQTKDAERDAALKQRGVRVMRFETAEVSRAPMRVVATLTSRLVTPSAR